MTSCTSKMEWKQYWVHGEPAMILVTLNVLGERTWKIVGVAAACQHK